MAAITQAIPNLLGGVSQQPDPVKLPGQVREAINTYLDPTFGCSKRPPTRFINSLATDVPEDAKWFPIFRDKQERYVACIYKEGNQTKLRVWECSAGTEKTVTMSGGSQDYLNAQDFKRIHNLTVNDYTFITNPEKVVTISSSEATTRPHEAVVIINQVSYNTTYAIDFQRGSGTSDTKVYRATQLSIDPGNFQENDGGVCDKDGVQTFTESSGAKTGLVFKVQAQCAAYLPSSDARDYKSRYSVNVTLMNGGVGWRVGDTVKVTLKGKEYTVTVTKEDFTLTSANDGSASFTSPPDTTTGGLDVAQVTAGLVTEINKNPHYQATAIGNVVYIKSKDGVDFNLYTRGGTANKAMLGIKNVVNDIGDLPEQGVEGMILRVRNTESAESDDYYVKFVSSTPGSNGLGSWEETVKPGISINFNDSTMPHALIRESNGNFTLRPLSGQFDEVNSWASRAVGDDKTNPVPTFVGRGISSVFFYQNRLGFLSEDSVILSQAGDYFNFWQGSAIAIADSDPIDITANSVRPAILKAAVGTSKGLLLFANNSQFLLSSTETAFAASTVKMNEISNYNYESHVLPVETGVSTVFVSEADTYSKVFEMAVDSSDNRPQVADATRVIPQYIPPGLTFYGNTPNNSMFLLGNDTDTVFVFKFFNQGNERQLAGWSRWLFPAQVRLFSFDNDTAFLVMRNGSDSILCGMELLDDQDSAPINSYMGAFTPRLDLYQTNNQVVVDPLSKYFKVYFKNGSHCIGASAVIIFTAGTRAGTFLNLQPEQDATGWHLPVPDKYLNEPFIIGYGYDMVVDLPSMFVIQENKADRKNIPVVENLYLDLFASGQYIVEVNKQGYTSVTMRLEATPADVYGSNTPTIDEVVTKSVPIFIRGDLAYVSIYAPDPVPGTITSYSWTGHYNNRGIAYLK